MMEHLVDFVNFMIFSSLDYFAVFLIIFSVFNLYPEYHKKEIAFMVLISTITSYALTMASTYDYVPSSIVTPLVMFLLMILFVRKKILYTLIVIIVGFIVYALIQLIVAGLTIYFGFINASELSISFSNKTYFIQTITSTIGCAVAVYTRISRGGFGFSFRKGGYKIFVITAFIILSSLSLTYYTFTNYNATTPMFCVILGLFLVSTLILCYFSYKQDNYEYR